jgi:hypothetical protein
MHLSRITFLGPAVLGLCVTLVDCGSQSYEDAARPAISSIQSDIASYNRSRPTDLKSTAGACIQALDGLKSVRPLVQDSPPKQYQALIAALRTAISMAQLGFADCAHAVPSLNFPLMFQADREIAAANRWILRARALDR